MDKQKIGQYLLYVVMFALVASGVGKFVNAADFGAAFGNARAPYILGVLELFIFAALVIPRTRMLGIILAASYFGGAICAAWLIEGEFPIAGIVVNTILYMGAYLYRPSLADGRRVVEPALGATRAVVR